MRQIYRCQRNCAALRRASPARSNPDPVFTVLGIGSQLRITLLATFHRLPAGQPHFFFCMTRTLRLLGLLATFSLSLAACSSGNKPGDTNVEQGSAKALEPNNRPSRTSKDNGEPQTSGAISNGDSLAAGIGRDTVHRPTGKQIYKAADRAIDRNHDGIAD